jgi:bifunctional UDP-N-acetylglucosamine pyrophosphorylase/glucosamine-1-phosphate N-acetyltransferase
MDKIAVIILAAGKGERMKSRTPKVLHPICGRPMLEYILDLSRELKIKKSVLVLGHQHQEVGKALPPGVKYVIQRRLLGTADAVKTGLGALKRFRGSVLVLYADIPLLKKETLCKLIEAHLKNAVAATILTAEAKDPHGYGRILRDKYGGIAGIAEEKDADDFQKNIKEINTGIICFKKDALAAALRAVRPNNRKREYYLTDTIGIIHQKGGLVEGLKIKDPQEAAGINTRWDLSRAEKAMQQRINRSLTLEGVSIVDPATTFIAFGAKIGQDSVIYPFTVIGKSVKIGKRCQIGPFAHIREGSVIADDCSVGNFLEIVRSRISAKTFIRHFSYIGDSVLGRAVNIGAGTVTANFDGKNKQRTIIGDGAFIGSDTVLVAPVKVGRRCRTGAGSVVLKDVAAGKTVAGIPAKILKSRR